MTVLADYGKKYRDVTIRREDGIIEVAVHSQGWRMINGVHDQLAPAFREIAEDPENRVMILTGIGSVFSQNFDRTGMPDTFTVTPAMWDHSLRTGRAMLQNLLAIEIPIIGAVNGPAFIHAELLALSDIVIAADTAAFADKAHMTMDVVPGDGVQIEFGRWWCGPAAFEGILVETGWSALERPAVDPRRPFLLNLVGSYAPHFGLSRLTAFTPEAASAGLR